MASAKRIDLNPVAEGSLYPDALRQAEEARGRARRIGVALSGGGIRSATLSLGFFQGLATNSLVQFVDYMSTVSGGGYFGGFFGHLLHRPPASYTGDQSARTKADAVLKDQDSAPLRFLRENGRYLSPNGAGDLLAAGAGALRNWVSVLVVLGLLALFVLTLITMTRYGVEDALSKWELFPVIAWPAWLSPLALLLAALAPIAILPPGWAYWLVREGSEGDPLLTRSAKWAAPIIGIVSLWYWYRHASELWAWTWEWVPVAFAVFSLLTVVRYLVAFSRSDSQQAMREHFTRGLARGLMVLAVLAVVVAVDSIGQSIVGLTDKRWIASYGGIAALVGMFRKQLLSLATRLRANEGPGLPKSVLFALTATALMLFLLGAVASVPHFVAQWNTEFPTWTPHDAPAGALSDLSLLALLAGAAAFAVSRVWSFVNRSSLHAVYEARIRRAYLGASNPARVGEGENRPAVTDPHPDDGLAWNAYNPSANGGPIHLVNVTINETVDGYSQVQQRDRKGVGMAIGPDGISVGRTHHALFMPSDAPAWTLESLNPFRRTTQLNMNATDATPPRFRVFPDGTTPTPEPLDVGQWVAISGGAVSTGLGARTNMALSILIGFFNVRLGYWWQSGVSPSARRGRTRRAWTQRLSAALRRLWPVQSALLDEWLARFPGVARHEWNLTDGGHFENMGAYELLRRRLPLIILCDNEEDDDYSFGGLSNLVRKARTDLNAEITFLDDNQLRSSASPFAMPMPIDVGTLDSLRRGKHTIEKVGNKEQVVVDTLETRLSWSHAAVARIEYKDKPESTFGCLLYVKPTLTGDEPIDVLQYHTEHPSFPQESTADQFFDEAQWESYRRLGEHMAIKLLARGASGLGDWMEKVAKGAKP